MGIGLSHRERFEMRSLASIRRETEAIAERTGWTIFAVDVGSDGICCPIFVAHLEGGEKPLYTATAPAGSAKRGAKGKIAKQIVEFLTKVDRATPREIQDALGLEEKQVRNALRKNLEIFERASLGGWTLRAPGIRMLPAGGYSALLHDGPETFLENLVDTL